MTLWSKAKMTQALKITSLTAPLVGLVSLPLHAATLEITATEVGGDVLLTGSGSIDLNSSGAFFAGADARVVGRSEDFIYLGSVSGYDQYDITVPFMTFASLGDRGFDFSVEGDSFGLDFTRSIILAVPVGYTSLDPINFIWTVSGTTIADIGLNFGEVLLFEQNTVTLVRGLDPTPVPLPAGLPLLLVSLGGVALLRRAKPAK